MPELSARRNIVVIADEAHRSQYDLDRRARPQPARRAAERVLHRLHRHADRQEDANTRAVFGDYISIYDIQRAVADKATVPIYYESRIAKLGLNAAALPKLDAEFEEITEGEEDTSREKLKSKWAALEALVGDPKRIKLIAADLVAHFERRLEAMDGKAMIVCMSRRICVELYAALIELRPDWASAEGRRPEAEKGRPAWSRCHDRQRRRRPRVAAAHPQQVQAPRAGQPLQGQQGPVPHRHRARHVADRLRRPLPAHDVRRQADAGPRADAGDRPRQPGLPRQAGRPGGRLPRASPTSSSTRSPPTPRAAARATRPSTPRRPSRHAGEARDRRPTCCTACTGRRGRPAREGAARLLIPGRRRSTSSRKDGKTALRAGGHGALRGPSPCAPRATRRPRSATMSPSSRP
jgi:hypothetical protein